MAHYFFIKLPSSTKISFYGGINEIGGNKFLVEDRGTRVFLDFGMQMEKVNMYYSDFLQPRNLNGMNDLFEFELLPRLTGLYRRDYSKHTNYGDHNKRTKFDAVLLTHAHLDHAAYIHYLRPDIMIYCTEATKLVLQAMQDTGGDFEYIIYKENFKIYRDEKGKWHRAKGTGHQEQQPRSFTIIENSKRFNIDSIEVEPLAVDHSIPGVSAFILHTSNGSIAYTADIRFHGRRKKDSERFLERCAESDIDYMLCEGTRINETSSKSESDVESEVSSIIKKTSQLVVCYYPPRDLDRLLSFYRAAVESGRDLVIDLEQAYLLKLFQESEAYRGVYPGPDDKNIEVYIPKSWGLIDKDVKDWPKELRDQDYDTWEREFLDKGNAVNCSDISRNQKEYVFFCSDYALQNLIDIRPNEGSAYIRSSTEPFNEEMEFDQSRAIRWLTHFKLISNEHELNRIHASGHGDGGQIRRIIQESKPKMRDTDTYYTRRVFYEVAPQCSIGGIR